VVGALLIAPTEAGARRRTTGIDRGGYLVESILGCGNCHTSGTLAGGPIASRNLGGGGPTLLVPPFAGVASNITPDRQTGIGSWSNCASDTVRGTGARQRNPMAAIVGRPRR
jgi:hypothetical protein